MFEIQNNITHSITPKLVTLNSHINIFSSVNANDFIPIFSIDNNVFYNNDFYYYIGIFQSTIISSKDILYAIRVNNRRRNRRTIQVSSITYPKKDVTFYISKGLIYTIEEGKIVILFVFGYEKTKTYDANDYMSINTDRNKHLEYLQSFENNEKIAYIDSSLFTNSKYSNILYYIKKHMFDLLYKNDVIIQIDRNIVDKCFKPTIISKKYNDFTDLCNDTVSESGIKSLIAKHKDFVYVPVLPEPIVEEVPLPIVPDLPFDNSSDLVFDNDEDEISDEEQEAIEDESFRRAALLERLLNERSEERGEHDYESELEISTGSINVDANTITFNNVGTNTNIISGENIRIVNGDDSNTIIISTMPQISFPTSDEFSNAEEQIENNINETIVASSITEDVSENNYTFVDDETRILNYD